MSETMQAGGPERPAGAEAVRNGVLLLLGALGGAPVPAREHLHVMAYQLSGRLPDLDAAARFEASEGGPRSPEVDGAVGSLEEAGLAARGPGGYALTEAGRAALGGQLPEGDGALRAADYAKSDLNSMTRDEVLALVHFTYDEEVPCARSGPEHERLSRIRRKLADAMHREDKLGVSMCACIAGVPLQEYMEAERARGWRTEWGRHRRSGRSRGRGAG